MPLFEGNISSAGLAKPQNMSDFRGKQALQYSGAYFTFDPRGKDPVGFTTWSNSNIALLDGRSPVSHLSGMEGQSHIIYRQDSNSSEEGHSHATSQHHTSPLKQGFTLYNRSPGISSPTAATSVDGRKRKTGGETSSPPSENSVYLAIPKPVYGHNPCCNELSCVLGQRYSVEHGSPRIPHTVYEHDWMQADAHYSERPLLQRKAQDALLQQRGLHFETNAEQLKRVNMESFSPGRSRTLPAVIDPNYSGYPYTLTRTLFGPLSEQNQRLQPPPRGYPGLYPSHPSHEHMTSEVYQEHSHMSKYGQLTQHPMFYYPQANVEVENRTQCKDIGSKQRDVPVFLKQTVSAPREHYIVPQTLHEIPMPPETLPNQAFLQGFNYACYAVPKFHLSASEIGAPLKRHALPSFHPNRINVSPPGQYIDQPMAKDKPNTSPHVDQSQPNSPFVLVEQTSPTRCQPGVSPSSIQIRRFFHPLNGLHIERPVLPPNGSNLHRRLDHAPIGATCQKQPKDPPVSPSPWLQQSPHHSSGRIQTVVANDAKVASNVYPPVFVQGHKHISPVISSGTTVLRERLKRSVSHSYSPFKIKEEDRDICEVEHVAKRQKIEVHKKKVESKTECPPMPVIDTVFSLAPYQTYLQASGVLFAGKVPQKAVQSAERDKIRLSKPRCRQEEQQPIVLPVSKGIRADTPKEKPVVKIFEPKCIKVEKIDPSDRDTSGESCQWGSSKVTTIKKEPEDTATSKSELMLVIKKCESDELEGKPSPADGYETSDESNPGKVTTQIDNPSQRETRTLHKPLVTIQPKPSTPPHPPESKPNFKNIPPQCLKLSTIKIHLRDPNASSPVPVPEQKVALLQTLERPTTVRKHFLELHQTLCRLLSKHVQASSAQELRTWLSKLELSEPASPSTKVQKVSCLLGMKAREVWLNAEMKSALHRLLERLREYTAQERCPFPHVMRTGAVFLPMLVVKEMLFPTVQGSFIDQVLQEHKVELRPTTLSEEKILIQLHKRACSSRLRRLMSLKHLPEIYADVVNLLYYTCVCKHLGLNMDDPANREKDEGCMGTSASSDITASPASPAESHPERHPKDQETNSNLRKKKNKSRVKSSSRRLFLDNSLSDEEATEVTVRPGIESVPIAYSGNESDVMGNEGSGREVAGFLGVSQSPTPENSWTCPLTLDEISPCPSDTEMEICSSPQPAKSPVRSSNCSGVILKLRRMFSKSLDRKKTRYQAVLDPGTLADCSLHETDNGEEEVGGNMDLQRTSKGTHRWQRTGSFCNTPRPFSSSSTTKRRSLLKIKYCPYLSACHSAEHRRRWVLRSAVQRAKRAMRIYYPDLVGKKIRHLYEEDDKSEVWYRGEVLRIHEAHTNPLKTIFEVRYDSEPEWKYYLELLIDYKKGWLKIED